MKLRAADKPVNTSLGKWAAQFPAAWQAPGHKLGQDSERLVVVSRTDGGTLGDPEPQLTHHVVKVQMHEGAQELRVGQRPTRFGGITRGGTVSRICVCMLPLTALMRR